MQRLKLAFTIFAVTFSTMLIEVLLTRVFSVIYFGQFAFLIISLALFGYGLSGVYLSISRISKSENSIRYLERFLLLFAVSVPVVYKLTLVFTIDFLHLFHPFQNFVFLVINFIILLIPFFFGGTSLALIFSAFSSQIGRLYFIDLVGAGLGSLAIIPLVPSLGPTRIMILLFLLVSIAWFWLSSYKKIVKSLVFAALLLASAFLYLYESAVFPIVPKLVEYKRFYNTQLEHNRMEFSKWSTIDKIDVAPWPWKPERKVIWINGGTMQSFIRKFDGDLARLQPIDWDPAAIPFQLTRKGSAIIIGSAGGYEVLCALSQKFRNVVAVEMDPVICSLLQNEYASYTGNIFHLPRVTLLADEGRSVLKRTRQKFDVIQMVNSHNSDSLLSGALSISETYIYTVESFKDYWDHLNTDGFLYIVHWSGERLFATAMQALREIGISDPKNKFFIAQDKDPEGKYVFTYFFLKKGDLIASDYEILKGFSGNKEIRFSPDQKLDNIFYRLADDPGAVIRNSSIALSPVYDRSPYFNQMNKIGQFRYTNAYVTGIARDVAESGIVYSNSIYLSILGLSLLFSIAFIFIPLARKSRKLKQRPLILYFFSIGLGYIMVEIIYIKIFQLFLGSPAISISIIIFSLLIASGVGSLLSGRIDRLLKGRMIPVFSLLVAAMLIFYGFFLFDILNTLFSLKFMGRILASVLLISLSGFFMGCFFPYGVKTLGEKERTAIGWAWGGNAFATVLGSILTVIVSINWNFTVVLALAAAAYLFSGWLIFRQQARTKG